MSNLITNNNRIRNSKILNALLNLNSVNFSGQELIPIGSLRKWKWGALGRRLGTKKSADGVVLDLPYARAPDGKKVVGKFIFSDGFGSAQQAQAEYNLTKLMGDKGLGPKVYGFYCISNPDINGVTSFVKHIHNKTGINTSNSNMMKYKTNMNMFNDVFVMVMENLYTNKYLKAAYTVDDAATKQFPIPIDKVRASIDAMHKLGIVHGDMHAGNIMIQIIKKPMLPEKFRVVIIDFGRSLKSSTPLNNASANALGMANRTKKNAWWYSNNTNIPPVLLNGNAWKYLQSYNSKKKNGLKTRIAGIFKKK
jgi:serine/threonine protein kinase